MRVIRAVLQCKDFGPWGRAFEEMGLFTSNYCADPKLVTKLSRLLSLGIQ